MKTYTIQELADRYGIGKQAVNSRINHLGIETELIANRTRVLEVDVLRLDGMDAFLKESKGHRYNDYIEPTEITEVSQMQELELAPETGSINNLTNQNQSGQLNLFKEFAIALVDVIDERIKQVATPPKSTKPPKSEILAGLEELEKAVKYNWLLSTSQVQGLIDKKPRGTVYVRGSFIFTKVNKLGAESGWKVTRNPEAFE